MQLMESVVRCVSYRKDHIIVRIATVPTAGYPHAVLIQDQVDIAPRLLREQSRTLFDGSDAFGWCQIHVPTLLSLVVQVSRLASTNGLSWLAEATDLSTSPG